NLEKLVKHVLTNTDTPINTIDNQGETILHKFAKNNNHSLISDFSKQIKDIINCKNNNSETAAVLACKNGCEETYYALKGVDADLSMRDSFGNTVGHYICLNGMCLGSIILNTKNL